jgi:hypothetical protein
MRACLIFVLASVLYTTEAFAAKEALLIANAEYSHFGKLPNPISDARQLGDVLRQIGFNVQVVENASREGMLDALSSFEERLKASRGIAFFHYGGHGVQVDGRNFLIPADADIPDEKRVATRAVDLEEVMGALDASGSSVNVVVLDACRDNPLPATSTRSATRGLSVVAAKPKNSIIIYAAEAGNKAQDGLFTPALAKALAVPGRPISEVMTEVRREVYERSGGLQTPGEYNQLFQQVILVKQGLNEAGSVQTLAYRNPSPYVGASQASQGQHHELPENVLNSLGHQLVRIPGTRVSFAVWPVRVSDYEAFVHETRRAWKPAGFPQEPDHPAVRINYYDAQAFCRWLTQKERTDGRLPSGFEYRLPRDHEWSAAVATSGEIDGPPKWRAGGLPNTYSWGSTWPPPRNSGNYDQSLGVDKYPYTSPVGAFTPNQYGLYDMNGNVYEWIEDDYDESGQGCLRGGSWPDNKEESINISNRFPSEKSTAYKVYGFRFVAAPVGS